VAGDWIVPDLVDQALALCHRGTDDQQEDIALGVLRLLSVESRRRVLERFPQ